MVIKKIILKKTDATASIILFIFSSFLLPRNIYKISLKKILTLMKPFDKNESTIRMGLSRAVSLGLIKNIHENGRVYYEIKENGLKSIEEIHEVMRIFSKKINIKRNGWNHFWMMININSDIEQELKDNFIEHLHKLHFACFSKGCYIYPYDMTIEIEKILKDLKIEDYVNIFTSKLISSQNALKFVQNLWPLEELRIKYTDFIEKYSYINNWSYSGGSDKLLPLCNNFVYALNEIIGMDPVLPNEFLGSGWEGEAALKILESFNKNLVPPTKDFVYKIIDSPE